MRIIYIIDIFDTDKAGTEVQLIKIIKGMTKNNHKVCLICLRPHKWIEDNGGLLGCEIKIAHINSLKTLKTIFSIYKLSKIIKEYHPDIVHTFFPVSNVIGVLAAKLAGINRIISSRRDYGEWMKNFYLPATKFANMFADYVVSNSTPVAELTIKKEKLNTNKSKVILNGIEIEPTNNKDRKINLKKKLHLDEKAKIVILVSNFRKMKRHDTCIEAASLVLKNNKNIHFVLIGDNAENINIKEDMEKRVRRYVIYSNVHFLGRIGNVRELLKQCNVGINCSEMEGLSNAIMEYMIEGLPCVVSDGGGNPDLIEHEVNGMVFETGDYKRLAEYIQYILYNENKAKLYAAKSKEILLRKMSITTMIQSYEKLYQQ